MKRVIVSGGGTGGHIYPAVAVAEALRRRFGEEVEILLRRCRRQDGDGEGACIGIPDRRSARCGLAAPFRFENLAVPFKVLKASARPGAPSATSGPMVVGFGGYASGPVLWAAQRMGIPTVIQEQNSYAGVTNKLLAKRARTICVSYEGMERFFPKEKIVMTGNPSAGTFFESGCGSPRGAGAFRLPGRSAGAARGRVARYADAQRNDEGLGSAAGRYFAGAGDLADG